MAHYAGALRCFTLSLSLQSVSFHSTTSLSGVCTALALCGCAVHYLAGTPLYVVACDRLSVDLSHHSSFDLSTLCFPCIRIEICLWTPAWSLSSYVFSLLFAVIFQITKTQSQITVSKAETSVRNVGYLITSVVLLS